MSLKHWCFRFISVATAIGSLAFYAVPAQAKTTTIECASAMDVTITPALSTSTKDHTVTGFANLTCKNGTEFMGGLATVSGSGKGSCLEPGLSLTLRIEWLDGTKTVTGELKPGNDTALLFGQRGTVKEGVLKGAAVEIGSGLRAAPAYCLSSGHTEIFDKHMIDITGP